MSGPVSREGTIPADGVLDLLRELEAERTSGVIRFDVGDGREHEVWVIGGQLALDQPHVAGHEGDDPVELWLAARGGHYRVVPRLPPLPVAQGDDDEKRGSLGVHAPADLLAYCERAGLTGTLALERPRKAGGPPEAVLFVYERGELLAVHGFEGSDVNDAFGWEEGSFRVRRLPSVAGLDGSSVGEGASGVVGASGAAEARSETAADAPGVPADPGADGVAPQPGVEDDFGRPSSVEPSEREDATVAFSRAARRRQDETGRTFLRVVETTLGAIVDEAEKRRSHLRSSPALDPGRARPSSAPPPVALPRPSVHGQRPVRIVYLSAEIAQPPALRAPPTSSQPTGAATDVPRASAAGRASGSTSIGATLAAAATVARTSDALPATIPPEAIGVIAAASRRMGETTPRRAASSFSESREIPESDANDGGARVSSTTSSSVSSSPVGSSPVGSSPVGSSPIPSTESASDSGREPVPSPRSPASPLEPAPAERPSTGLSPWALLVAVVLVAGAVVVVWVSGR
jgi:hypothetical protein